MSGKSHRLLEGEGRNCLDAYYAWFGWCSGSFMLCRLVAEVVHAMTRNGKPEANRMAFEITQGLQDKKQAG